MIGLRRGLAALATAGLIGLTALHAQAGLAARPVAVQITASPTPSGTPVPSKTLPPTNTPIPTATPPPTNTPPPTPTPRPIDFGALSHSVMYDDGREIFLIGPDGKSRVGVALLSTSHFRPRSSGFGQVLYYNNGYWLGDIYGHQHPISPPLAAGETVFDGWPSPDGQYIAWQLVTQAPVDGMNLNMGASRVVITDQTGGNARTILQQSAGTVYGDVPLLYGWRPGHPPTLLVQTFYGSRDMLGLHKGLEEFDPQLGDLVGDYLPPIGEDTLPTGEVLDLSPSGNTIAYASQDTRLPSGEGPFPATLSALSLNGRHVTVIDRVADHKSPPTKTLPAPRGYYFSRQAFISPDDTRIAYTRIEVIYRNGATRSYLRPIACLANLDGTGKADFGPDERVMGWSDGHTIVVRRENSHVNGLYAVDLNTGKSSRVMLGSGLNVDGIIP